MAYISSRSLGLVLAALFLVFFTTIVSASPVSITRFSDGRNVSDSGLVVTANIVADVVKSNGSTCSYDFLNDSGCSSGEIYSAGSNSGVKVRAGSVVNFEIKVQNNGSSVVTLSKPFYGASSYGIGCAGGSNCTRGSFSNLDHGPYSFSIASVYAENNEFYYDCTLDRTQLEGGQTATGQCRLVVTDDLPNYQSQISSTTRAYYFLGLTLITSAGQINVDKTSVNNFRKQLIPMTLGTGSLSVNRVESLNMPIASDPKMPITYALKFNGSPSLATVQSYFSSTVFSSNLQTAGGPGINSPSCQITKASDVFNFVCSTPNDVFNSPSAPATILPAPFDYVQFQLFHRSTPSTTLGLNQKPLITQQLYYGQARRWHPSTSVPTGLMNKALEIIAFEATTGGTVYINRSENAVIKATFRSYARKNGYGGALGAPVSPSSGAFDRVNLRLYAVPTDIDPIPFLKTATPIFSENFDRTKASALSGNNFNYQITLTPTQLQNYVGNYQLLLVISDADKLSAGIDKAFFGRAAIPFSIVRVLQPGDDPFWDGSSVYDRLYDEVAHPIGLRNLFLGEATISVSVFSGNANLIHLKPSTDGSCPLSDFNHLDMLPFGSTYSATLGGRDTRIDPPAVNQWLCVDVNRSANEPGRNFTLRARLCQGSVCVTEDLLVHTNPTPHVLFPKNPLNAHQVGSTPLTFSTGEFKEFAFKNIYGSTNGGRLSGGNYLPGAIEAGLGQQRDVVNPYLALNKYSVCDTSTIPGQFLCYPQDATLCTPTSPCGGEYSLDNGATWNAINDVVNYNQLGLLDHSSFSTRSADNVSTGFTDLTFVKNVRLRFNQAGIYGLRGGMCDEPGNCSEPFEQVVVVSPQAYAATCSWKIVDSSTSQLVAQSGSPFPINLKKDQQYFLDVNVQNVGTASWTPLWSGVGSTAGTFLVGAGGDGTSASEDFSTNLGLLDFNNRAAFTNTTGSVAPNTSRVARIRMTPTTLARDFVTWRTLQEWAPGNTPNQVGWFGETCSIDVNVVSATTPGGSNFSCNVILDASPINSGEVPSFSVTYTNAPAGSIVSHNVVFPSVCQPTSCTAPSSSGGGTCNSTCSAYTNSGTTPIEVPVVVVLQATTAPSGMDPPRCSATLNVNPAAATGLADIIGVSGITVRNILFDSETDSLANVSGNVTFTFFKPAQVTQNDYTVTLLSSDGATVKTGTIDSSSSCLDGRTTNGVTPQICSFAFSDVPIAQNYRVKISVKGLTSTTTPPITEDAFANNVSFSNPFNVSRRNQLNIPDANLLSVVLVLLVVVGLLSITRKKA